MRSSLVLGRVCTLRLAGVACIPKPASHSLGVLLTLDLFSQEQIATVARGLYHQLHPFLHQKVLTTVTHAQVMSLFSMYIFKIVINF